ncbi:putative inner membrane protein [Legionella pneumophila]|uniref:lysoplasmalogenase n=1 Tax=Legionella pneumophila TaxID=446 RepID=UPI000B94B589|nr:lysoplasmalogenase [Legionella pneumophila]SNV98662.1 putative inner membrane protein [Legionella pneumophila]
MTYSFSKPVSWVFLFTAVIYLVSLSFIQYPATTVLKPIPIVCLIVGVFRTFLPSLAKIFLILALVFSLAGDVVLTLPVALQLELGIGCFLLAHCFYIALFLKSFQFNKLHFFYYILILLLMAFIAFTIIPYLGDLLIPVMIYFCVLMLMLFSAFQVKKETLTIGSGALFFLISDLTLALNLFVYTQADVRIFVMFTYYVAQFLLTFGLVRLYEKRG